MVEELEKSMTNTIKRANERFENAMIKGLEHDRKSLMNELETKLSRGNYRRIANEILSTCGESISEHTIGNVLNGRRNPSFRVAQLIAAVAGCTIEELAEYIESSRKSNQVRSAA